MNKREWLVSKGLAKPGRGKFSKEAEAAWKKHCEINDLQDLLKPAFTVPVEEQIEGQITIEEAIEELPRDGFTLAKLPEDLPVIRKENLAYTVDDAGRMIAHGECGTCRERVNKCNCDGGPDGLRYITPKQKAYLVVK